MLINGIRVRSGLRMESINSVKAIAEIQFAIGKFLPKNGNGERKHWEAQKIEPVATIVLKPRAFQEKPLFVIDKGFDIEPI